METQAFLVVLALALGSDDPQVLISRATTDYYAAHYAKAAEFFEAAVKAGASGPAVPYSLACCYSRLDKTDAAFLWLDKALAAGWRDVDMMKSQPDFDALHADPRWDNVVKQCQSAMDDFIKSLKEPALREELLKRMREDQRIRMSAKPGFLGWSKAREWRKIDADNTALMKTVIKEHGWPGKSIVGADGEQAAFLLVQHADADVAFQKQCLKLLKKAVKQKEAPPDQLAYLTDRVLVAEGNPQRYGTQFHTVNGELKPQPIEHEENVDRRREKVGLPPLQDYIKQMRGMEQSGAPTQPPSRDEPPRHRPPTEGLPPG